MKFAAVFFSTFLLGPTLPAQQPDTLITTTDTHGVISSIVSMAAPRCPIGMRALQGSSMQMLRAEDGKRQPMLRPSLILIPVDGRLIATATVTAHGYSGSAETTPALAKLNNGRYMRTQINRRLTLTYSNGSASAELQLPGFAVVESIELNAVTYRDGSTWKLAADSGCRVAPDPLLLIGTR